MDCCFLVCKGCPERFTLQGTNISPTKALLKMVFLFPWWDMLVPGRVAKKKGLEYQHLAVLGCCLNPKACFDVFDTPYHPFSTPWKSQVCFFLGGGGGGSDLDSDDSVFFT